MWVKTTNDKYSQYNISLDKQRKLADDETLMHMELQDNPEFFIAIREDLTVKLFTEDELKQIADIDNQTEKVISETIVDGEVVKETEPLTKQEKKALIEAKELEIANARIEAKITRDDLLDEKDVKVK